MATTQKQGASARVPQTRAELEQMGARRGELKSQLRDAENRRLNLAAQLDATPGEARRPVMERLATLDQRITQIEREVLQMDEAISTAMANPKIAQAEVHVEPEPPVPPPPPAFPFEHAPATEGVTVVPSQPPGIDFGSWRTVAMGSLSAIPLVALLAAWIAWRLALRRLRREGVGGADPAHTSKLQQSVDAIALEVERISENQRYVTKVLNQGAAEPVQSRVGDEAPVSRGQSST
jgi:hypothetical protein